MDGLRRRRFPTTDTNASPKMLFIRTLIVSLFSVGQRFCGGLTLDKALSLAERGEAPPNCYITVV